MAQPYLRVSLGALSRALGARLPAAEHAQYTRALERLSSASLRRHTARSLALCNSLELTRGGAGQEVAAESKQVVTEGLITSLAAAGYVPLTSREMEYARVTAHLFALPVNIDWTSLDSAAFPDLGGRAYSEPFGMESGDGDDTEPAWASRMLVYHRGRGIDVSAGWFFAEKLEEVSGSFERWCHARFVTRPTNAVNRAAQLAVEPAMRAVQLARTLGRSSPTLIGGLLAKAGVPATRATPLSDDEAAAAVERKRASAAAAIEARRTALLHERFSGRGANWVNKLRSGADGSSDQGLSWFFGTATLREPTYEDVVVAYVKRADDGRHGLSLRAFRNIPAADLEMCLPSLHPYALAPSDRVTLRLSAIFAAFVGAFSYHQLGHPSAGGWTIGYIAASLTALSTFGAYTTRTLLRWRNSSLWTHQLVTTHMVEKAYARGDAVLAQCAFDAHAQVRAGGREKRRARLRRRRLPRAARRARARIGAPHWGSGRIVLTKCPLSCLRGSPGATAARRARTRRRWASLRCCWGRCTCAGGRARRPCRERS